MPRPERRPAAAFTDAWWKKPDPEEAARALHSQASAIEQMSFGRRYRHALLYRLVTGEDSPAIFGYWMSPRVPPAVGALNLANYVEPADNIVAEAVEVFENRIGTLRPFVQVIPNGGDFSIREACRQAEWYLDALFEQVKLYDKTRLQFRDAATWGTGHIKVAPSHDGKQVVIERVLDDELLVDEMAAIKGNPGALQQRVYMTREDAYSFVDSAPANERDAIAGAIRTAPRAHSGSFWSEPQSVEMIALIEGWKLPGLDGKPGRRLLALPNCKLEDDSWKRDHFPFASLRWSPQSLGWRGQGAAWQLLPYQVKLNNATAVIEANKESHAWASIIVEGNSKITTAALGGRPRRIIRYQGIKPEFQTHQSNAPELYQDRDFWKVAGFMRVGLNQQTASGLKQPGITSGKALRTMVQIEDARNKSLQIALENCVKDIAVLSLEAAQDVKLAVTVPGVLGRTLKWDDIAKAVESGRVGVFPVHALINDPEGRDQQVADWYADGLIDKRAYFRLQQMPDTQAYSLLANAEDDLIESTLDQIVKTGEYVPPEVWDDMPQAFKTAKSRHALEKRLGTPKKTLRLLQQFMTALAELMANPQGQTLQPGITPPAAGPQAPGAAPAPPPLQSSPTIGAPAALPAAA